MSQIFRSRLAALMLTLGGLLGGCGSISVAVDVLNPEHVRSRMDEVAVRKLYREIQSANAGVFAARVDRRFTGFSIEVNELADRISKTASALPQSDRLPIERAAAMLAQGVGPGGTYRHSTDVAGAELEVLAQAVRDDGVIQHYDGAGPLPETVRTRVLEFQAKEKSVRSEQINVVRTAQANLRQRVMAAAARAAAAAPPAAAGGASGQVTTAAAAPLAAADAQANVTVAAASRSIIGDGSLAATEFAYAVASAPDNLWKRDFNNALAKASFGNSDMVIRLNSTADFSVKGLSFDASKVAQVASKLLTQTVLVSAQVAGVPVPTARPTPSGGSATGGEALSASSAELATAEKALAVRDARLAAQKTAIRSLSQSMLQVTPQLGGSLAAQGPADASRAAIHNSIGSQFEAIKSLLNLQDIQ